MSPHNSEGITLVIPGTAQHITDNLVLGVAAALMLRGLLPVGGSLVLGTLEPEVTIAS